MSLKEKQDGEDQGQPIILQLAQDSTGALSRSPAMTLESFVTFAAYGSMTTTYAKKITSSYQVRIEKAVDTEANLRRAMDQQMADKFDAYKKETDSKISDMETKVFEMQRRMASMEQRLTKVVCKQNNLSVDKQPRPSWTRKDHPEMPKNIVFKGRYFGWKKRIQGKLSHKSGYKNIADAQAGLALHLKTLSSGDVASLIEGE